jgi:hypothetical protein
MTGYQDVLRIRKLEQDVERLGMRMGPPRHGLYNAVALFPLDDALPIYSRDAELFAGSLDEMEVWLRGWQQAQLYHSMLIGRNFEKTVARKEQDYRNQRLMQTLKETDHEH